MNTQSAAIVWLGNPGDESVCGIAPGSRLMAFMNTALVREYGWSIESSLASGALVGETADGTMLDWRFAAPCWHQLCEDVANFRAPLESPEKLSFSLAVLWNLRAAPYLIAIVRGEMLDGSLTALGVSPFSILQKLGTVLQLISTGMFIEAAEMFLSVETDAFLTTERIDVYRGMLLSSNLISQ